MTRQSRARPSSEPAHRVQVVAERRFDPPRPVEILGDDGAWHRGRQSAWRLCDDGRGWRADVRWTQRHEWGQGGYMRSMAGDRVRPVAGPELSEGAGTVPGPMTGRA